MDDQMLLARLRFLRTDIGRCIQLLEDPGFDAGAKASLRGRFERLLTAWPADGQDWQRHGRLHFLRTLDGIVLAGAIWSYARAAAKKVLQEPLSDADLRALNARDTLSLRLTKASQSAEVEAAKGYVFAISMARDDGSPETIRSMLERPSPIWGYDRAGELVRALANPAADGTVLKPLAIEDAEEAVAVWSRSRGRPTGSSTAKPRWEFLADVCERLGLGRVSPESLKDDWREAKK